MAFEIPDACTLPTADRPVRLAEFDSLLGTAVSTHRDDATHLTFWFSDSPGVEGRVRDLSARESTCCSFFEFTVVTRADHVVLGIHVPDQHSSILDSLETRAGQRA